MTQDPQLNKDFDQLAALYKSSGGKNADVVDLARSLVRRGATQSMIAKTLKISSAAVSNWKLGKGKVARPVRTPTTAPPAAPAKKTTQITVVVDGLEITGTPKDVAALIGAMG
jgi:hypothetical protein